MRREVFEAMEATLRTSWRERIAVSFNGREQLTKCESSTVDKIRRGARA